MMFGYGGMGMWGFAFMTVSTVLFWALLVLAIIALVRYLVRTSDHRGLRESDSIPERLLSERFARGEVDEEEYRRRLQVLNERARGPR